MSNYENLQTSNKNGILIITVDRVKKLNALNKTTITEIDKVIQEVSDDSDIKGAVITGAGDKSFVAGADISEISELNEVNGRKFSESGQEVFTMIERCDKPIIAAINGYAMGGGLELAMACHLRVASSNAKFAMPEVNLGVIPGFGGTQRLTQLVGKAKALELIMTANTIGAEEAHTLGLVNHVCDDKAAMMAKAMELMGDIIDKAPLAIGMVIDCVNAALSNELNGYQTEANSFGSCCKTKDFQEGTAAFLAKRSAQFTGE